MLQRSTISQVDAQHIPCVLTLAWNLRLGVSLCKYTPALDTWLVPLFNTCASLPAQGLEPNVFEASSACCDFTVWACSAHSPMEGRCQGQGA